MTLARLIQHKVVFIESTLINKAINNISSILSISYGVPEKTENFTLIPPSVLGPSQRIMQTEFLGIYRKA